MCAIKTRDSNKAQQVLTCFFVVLCVRTTTFSTKRIYLLRSIRMRDGKQNEALNTSSAFVYGVDP